MKTKIIYIIFFFSIFMLSCRSNPQVKNPTPTDAGSLSDNSTMPHLIADYSGMKDDAYVASAWIDTNFTLEECADVKVQPVLNLSKMNYPHGQERIEASLNASIAAKKKNPAGKSFLVTAAITAMRGKPSFIKRFSLTYEDVPSIELEVIISEAQSKRERVKFCHMARGKDTAEALEKLLRDVTAFINKRL
jgi:hypothetical protein